MSHTFTSCIQLENYSIKEFSLTFFNHIYFKLPLHYGASLSRNCTQPFSPKLSMASGCRIRKASTKKARKAHSRIVRIVHDSRFAVMPWKNSVLSVLRTSTSLRHRLSDLRTLCQREAMWKSPNSNGTRSSTVPRNVEKWYRWASIGMAQNCAASWSSGSSAMSQEAMHMVTNDAVKASIFLPFQKLSKVWTNLKSISFSIIQSLLDNFHQEGFHLVFHGEFQLFHSRIKLMKLDLHRLNAKLYRPTSAPQETCQVEHLRRTWCSIWSLLL